MLSYRTRQKLAALIKSIADGERRVEVVRQVLAENRDFEPYTAFKRLDRERNGFLTTVDFQNFFDDNKVVMTQKELLNVFRLYDRNSNGRVSYNEFMDGVLPQADNQLREICTLRKTYAILSHEYLPDEVEWGLAKIFNQNARNYREQQDLRNVLESSYDFNHRDVFNTIDVQRFGWIGVQELDDFLQSNDVVLSQSELDAFFRFVDDSQDGRINLLEWQDNVLPLGSGILQTQVSPSRRVIASPSRQSPSRYNADYSTYLARSNSPSRRNNMTQSLRSSNLKTSELRTSQNLRNSQTLRTSQTLKRSNYETPTSLRRESPSRSNVSKMTATRISPSKISPMRGNEEEIFVKALKLQIECDRDIEEARKALSLRSDFNLLDGFRLFDPTGKGFITVSELAVIFEHLDFYATRDECFLFFNRYDRDEDGLLRYSDFCKVYTPQFAEYAIMLKERNPFYLESVHDLSLETRRLLKRLFELLINGETQAESNRQRLARRPLFRVTDAFAALDTHDQGFITLDEFRDILEDWGIFASTKDLVGLTKRYDRNQDGKISYSEFVDEMTPKSPQKY